MDRARERVGLALFFLALVSWTSCHCETRPPTSARNRALLVGISHYPQGSASHWDVLSGADDAKALAPELERFGFEVRILPEKEASREGVLRAMDDWLIGNAEAGGAAVFYFSGHGQKLPEPGQPLRFVTSLVPITATSKLIEAGQQTNIMDFEIASRLRQLRARVGKTGSVLAVLDSCSSGRRTLRLTEVVRGIAWDVVRDGPEPTVRAAADPNYMGFLPPAGSEPDDYVVIAAARQNELATQPSSSSPSKLGLLTKAFIANLRRATSTTTYRELFQQVAFDVTTECSAQHPQLEGKGIDEYLFSGRSKPPLCLTPILSFKDHHPVIGMGALHGASLGSRFALHRTGTAPTGDATPVAHATVTTVFGFTSDLTLDEAVSEDVLRGACAVEESHVYDSGTLLVRLQPDNPYRADLKEFELVDVTAQKYDVDVSAESGAFVVKSPEGVVMQKSPISAGAAGLVSVLRGLWRWTFARELTNVAPHSGLHIDVRMVPIIIDRNDCQNNIMEFHPRTDRPPAEGNQNYLVQGDDVILQVRMPGCRPGYLTVLSLGPEGRVTPMFPLPQYDDANLYSPSLEWVTLPPCHYVWTVDAPFEKSEYLVKALFTIFPADFSMILSAPLEVEDTSRLLSNRAAMPLGQLLDHLRTGTRGRAELRASDWTSALFHYVVRRRE